MERYRLEVEEVEEPPETLRDPEVAIVAAQFEFRMNTLALSMEFSQKQIQKTEAFQSAFEFLVSKVGHRTAERITEEYFTKNYALYAN